MKTTSILLFCSLLMGCSTFSSKELKNYGGQSNVVIQPNGTVTVGTLQPDNPNTTARQTVAVGPGKELTITQETGGAYENKLGKLKGLFGMAKIYHMAAILCFIVGAIIISLPVYFSNKIGWCVCGAGAVLMVVGTLLPDLSKYIGIAALIAVLVGIWYMYHKHLLYKTPPVVKTTES